MATLTQYGPDVSAAQGNIDFASLAGHVDFVLIRIGYGGNIEAQDDRQIWNNIAGCQAYNIPFGLYIYSYALDEAGVRSEVDHMMRIFNTIQDKTLLTHGLWYDMEDADGYKERNGMPFWENGPTWSYFINLWTSLVYSQTYQNYPELAVGYYASMSPIKSLFSGITTRNVWVAYWGNNSGAIPSDPPDVPYIVWQYTSNGDLPGIGNRVDMNIFLYDEPSPDPPTPPEPPIPPEPPATWEKEEVSIEDDLDTDPGVRAFSDICKEVVAGTYGYDTIPLMKKLSELGYNPNMVLLEVRRYCIFYGITKFTNLQIAYQCLYGIFGYGATMDSNLTHSGYNPNVVRNIMNNIIHKEV